MTATKAERKAQEIANRVQRLNDTRKLINEHIDTGSVFLKQKKQLAMDLYHFYLTLEKKGAVDDEEPELARLPQFEKKPAPLELPTLEEARASIALDGDTQDGE